jgi:amino-acid N-acetyltransferase
MQVKKAENYRKSMIQLLTSAKLPVEDLPLSLENFFVAVDDNNVIGVAGLEIYGDHSLLRSMAVEPEYRNKGVATCLLATVEALAALKNVKAICLLTETASEYFSRKGYRIITRDDVPVAVKVSSEFSHVCPVSAIVMTKQLILNEKYISTMYRQ